MLIPNSDKKNKLDKPFIGPHEVKELLPYGNLLLDIGYRVNQNQCRVFKGEMKSRGDVNGMDLDDSLSPEMGHLNLVGCDVLCTDSHMSSEMDIKEEESIESE